MTTATGKHQASRRVLNPRAAIVMAVVLVTGWFALNKLHDRQFGRTQEFLKASALAALEKQEYREARKRMTQYLAMRPRDREVKQRLAELLASREHGFGTPATLEQAFSLNEDLLRAGDATNDLRLHQAEIAVTLNRTADADAHLKLLRSTMPDVSRVWYLSGLAALQQLDSGTAREHFRHSLECADPPAAAFAELASLLMHDPESVGAVDSLLADMVERCPRSAALDARARWLVRHNQFPKAIPDLEQLLESEPAHVAWNAMLVRCLQKLSLAAGAVPDDSEWKPVISAAVQRLQVATSTNESDPELSTCLAALLWANGHQDASLKVLDRQLARTPQAGHLHELKIEYLCAAGRPGPARTALEELPEDVLSQASERLCAARVLMAEQEWEAADRALQDALSVGDATRAIHSRILLSRAICQSRSGQNGVAMELFEDLASRDPEMLSARLGVAASRLQSGQYELALAEYRQLLAAPGVAAFLSDLLIRKNLEQPQELRDWSEVDSLTRDEQPLIPDPVQRALLRADRCIASNDVVDAVNELELAASAFSGRPEPARAVERIRITAAEELRRQLEGTQSTLFAAGTGLPKPVIAAAVWLRLQPSIEPEILAKSLGVVFKSESKANALPDRVRWLQFEHAVFRSAAAMELEAGRTTAAAGWQSLAFRRAHELASLDVREAVPFAIELVQLGRGEEARAWLMSLPDTAISAVERANLMTSIVLSANTSDPVINRCLSSVYELIQKERANQSLWLCYADALRFSGNDAEALQTLDAIASALQTAGSLRPHTSDTFLLQEVALRRAGILAMSREKPAQAAAEIEQTFAGEGPELRRLEVLARCQFVAGDAAAAVATLTAIDRHQRTLPGDITLAAAMHSLGRTTEFRRLQHQLRWRRHCELLPESDAGLLQSVLSIDALSVPSSSSLLTAQ